MPDFIINSNYNEILSPSANLCEIIEHENKLKFHKIIKNKSLINIIRKIESPIAIYFINKMPIYSHRTNFTPPNELIEKEIKTINLWLDNNINCPKILEWNSENIYYEYLSNASTIRKIIRESKSPETRILEKTIKSYNHSRELALKENNPYFFHSDPHLGNFIYSHDNDEIYMIDPGVILKNKDINSLDLSLLANFLFSITTISKSENINKEYSRLFCESYDTKTRQSLVDIFDSKLIVPHYIFFREFAKKIIKKKYDKNSIIHKMKLFNNSYKNYIRKDLVK
jgi:hypothetical protein